MCRGGADDVNVLSLMRRSVASLGWGRRDYFKISPHLRRGDRRMAREGKVTIFGGNERKNRE